MMEGLPKSVREIAEVIGLKATIRLISQLPVYQRPDRKLPTVMMYVPKRLQPDHPLVEILGWDTALKLVRAFGGEILYPANCRHVFKQVRDDAMVRMVEMGARIEVVADLFGMTPRAVRGIVAKQEKEPEDAARRGGQIGADSTEGEHRGL
jgi:hypothetical protein